MSGQCCTSPWVAAIENYTESGVRNTLNNRGVKVTTVELVNGGDSKRFPNGIRTWYGVVLQIKRRKKQYQLYQKNNQGATIPVDKYSRFAVFQEVGSRSTVVMFIPGSTLDTNFYVKKICWPGSGVILIDPVVTGEWNSNVVITTEHPFIPFDIEENLSSFPSISSLPDCFPATDGYQGFLFRDMNPLELSEMNLVSCCPNMFCDSNHKVNEICPCATGSRIIKRNCLEGNVCLPKGVGKVGVKFMSMNFSKRLLAEGIISDPNRSLEVLFLRQAIKDQMNAIQNVNIGWYILGWYRSEKDILTSKFHITRIGCKADTSLIKIELECTIPRQPVNFPDIYKNAQMSRLPELIPIESNYEIDDVSGGGAGYARGGVDADLYDESLDPTVAEEAHRQAYERQELIEREAAARALRVAGEFEKQKMEYQRISELNRQVNTPPRMAWRDDPELTSNFFTRTNRREEEFGGNKLGEQLNSDEGIESRTLERGRGRGRRVSRGRGMSGRGSRGRGGNRRGASTSRGSRGRGRGGVTRNKRGTNVVVVTPNDESSNRRFRQQSIIEFMRPRHATPSRNVQNEVIELE